MELRDIINGIYALPEESLDKIVACTDFLSCKRGTFILEAGKVERDIFLISSGIARAYVLSDGKEVTFWIGCEGSEIISLDSYVNGRAGYETIELMEDSELYRLRTGDLQRLFATDINIANWGRKLAEQEFLRTEKRMIPLLSTTASARYEALLKNSPELLRRIPLECLATYLGITPVSLSRIRSKLKCFR